MSVVRKDGRWDALPEHQDRDVRLLKLTPTSVGLNFGAKGIASGYGVTSIVALHAPDFRTALTSLWRYKRLTCPELVELDVQDNGAVTSAHQPRLRASQTKGNTPMRPSLSGGPCASSIVALRSRATLRELREGLRQRLRVRQDIEHPSPLERRTDDPLVKLGRDVDAAMSDAIVVRRRRCKAFGASLGRDASSGRVDGDSGIVVHPQHAPSVE
ncbi:hypothetical protein CSC75_19155 [Pseudoxanthomonas wuyuanensis]|nr:hypothetical protein CSC75_19155 [Pseudoxanthomonas wuyuanensis]